jgi:hypothetical protein
MLKDNFNPFSDITLTPVSTDDITNQDTGSNTPSFMDMLNNIVNTGLNLSTDYYQTKKTVALEPLNILNTVIITGGIIGIVFIIFKIAKKR